MSVTDPLIKDVKGCVQQFLTLNSSGTIISDNNFYFVLFAQTLEKIFNKGLIRQQNTKFFDRTIDAYSWMVSVAKDVNLKCDFSYRTCVDQVIDRLDVNNNDGRFRLLIKYCLVKKCLHVPVEALVRSHHGNVFYLSSSILGDEILTEILLSVLRQISNMSFRLDLTNASFLDFIWYIPEALNLELVPCRTLGIAVSFTDNKAVIVSVEPNGVAAENGNIKVGDILDKLNDTFINSSSKGRLNFLMKMNRLQPVKIRIIKAYDKQSEQLYGPIQKMLRNLKIDMDIIKKQYEENWNVNEKKPRVYGYSVKYLAKVDVGCLGSVKQVQKALKGLLNIHCTDELVIKRIDKISSLEIGEIGLKIRDKESSNLILEHPYMKISSCGNIPFFPKVFGYCAGEETCDVAKQFCCFIFEATSNEDADLILQSIGQGFHRTHYAV